jgi:hypothetical protein
MMINTASHWHFNYILLLLASKPIIDLLWASKITHIYSFFVLLALPFLWFGLRSSVKPKSGNSTIILGIVAIVYLSADSLFLINDSESFTLNSKYLLSVVGLFILSHVFYAVLPAQINKMRLVYALIIATTCSLAACFLQVMGAIPYYVYDKLPYFSSTTNHWAEVGRLSGVYYHPLDLVRFLIWPYIAIGIVYFSKNVITRWASILLVALFLMQFLFLRTTHRATLVYSILVLFLIAALNRATKRFFVATTVTVLAWVISAQVFSYQTGFPFKTTFVPGHFFGSTIPKDYNDGPKVVPNSINRLVESTGLNLDKGAKYILRAQGRHIFWRDHIDYIKSFSLPELLLGANPRRTMPEGMEPQPHNQLLDWVERYGIIGSVFLTFVFCYFYWMIPSTGFVRFLVAMTICYYSIFTEIMIMPTFVWMAGFALYLLPHAEKGLPKINWPTTPGIYLRRFKRQIKI